MLIVVRTGLCDLPCELQDAIFAELCDPVDVFAFCLTASHFWRIGLSHYKALYMDYVRRAKDWSGDRLVCIGDNADDFPEGLFNDADFEVLTDNYFDCYGEDPSVDLQLIDTFQKLRDVKWPYRCNFRERCELSVWNPLARRAKERRHGPFSEMMRRLHPSIDLDDDEPGNDLPQYLPLYKYDFSAWMDLPKASGTLEHARPCILRNLSKKVYVRDDALALSKEDTNEEDEEEDEEKDAKPYYMSFGSLIVLRIVWSCELSLGTTNDDELCRGVWAGDRFDIVNIDAIEHEEGWTDVSTAAREQLIQTWRALFGASHWEAEVRESGL